MSGMEITLINNSGYMAPEDTGFKFNGETIFRDKKKEQAEFIPYKKVDSIQELVNEQPQ